MFTSTLADAIVVSTGVARRVVLSNDEWDDFCQKQADAFKLLDVKGIYKRILCQLVSTWCITTQSNYR